MQTSVSHIILDDGAKKLNAKQIEYILRCFPAVEEINFSFCENLDDLNIPIFLENNVENDIDGTNQPWLNNLTEIDLHASNVSGNAVAGIISHARNLQKINLSLCINLKDLDLSNIPMNSLEEIDLSRAEIPVKAIQQILNQAKNLKIIKLNDLQNLNDLDLSNMSLDNLESIELSSPSISANAISQILQQAKKLKNIDLSFVQQLNEIILPDDVFFDSLEEIDLTRSNVSSATLKEFFIKAKNLKKIYLIRCENINEISVCDGSLDNLEEIILNDSKISANAISTILNHAKNLKKIDMNSIQNLKDLNLSCANINSLEEITLSNTKTSADVVLQIFSKAKKLKKIYLYNMENLRDLNLSDLSLDVLGVLEEINLDYSNISADNLVQILIRAINLKVFEYDIGFEKELLSKLGLKRVDIFGLRKGKVLKLFIEKAMQLYGTKFEEVTETVSANSVLNNSGEFIPMYIKKQQASGSAEQNDLGIFPEHLQMSHEINDILEDGETLLTRSLNAEQIDYNRVLQIINDMEANVNIPNSNGRTPLHVLLNNYTNNPLMNDLVKLLLQNGAKVNNSLLILARERGCEHLFANASSSNKFRV